MRQFKQLLRQFWGHMPPETTAAQRSTLACLFMLDDGEEGAIISHADLGKLAGYSSSSSHRTTKTLETQAGHVASKPRFREDEDHSQAANAYAVLAFDAFERELAAGIEAAPDPHVKLLRGLSSVSNQQKEIPEKTVVQTAAPVDNCEPSLDPTPEDRAALAAAARGLKFPRREQLQEPEAGSPLAEVLARWGWDAYSDALDVVESPQARASPASVPLALAELLRRPRDRVSTPGAYLRSALKRIASGAGGPGLRSTRPAPDTPGQASELRAQLRTLQGMRTACLGDPKRLEQIDLALFKLGRQIVAEELRAS